MNVAVFNTCLLMGWLLVLTGGVWLNPGAGLAAAGALLIALTLLSARIAGGLVVPEPKKAEGP